MTRPYEIKLGGKTVRLLHFAPAHTDGDTIVYFPDLKVISAGDELNLINPNFDYAGGASITGWMNSCSGPGAEARPGGPGLSGPGPRRPHHETRPT